MRLIFIVLVATIGLVGGCATEDPLARLDAGNVSVIHVRGKGDIDIYKVIYRVDAPPEQTWEATGAIASWLQQASVVKDIEIESRMADPDRPRMKTRIRVDWSKNSSQVIEIERDDRTRLIDLTVLPESQELGRLAKCTVMISPYRSQSLVEADIRISSGFEHRLGELAMVLIPLTETLKTTGRLKRFWREIAALHREASLRPPVTEVTLSGRTHIVAVGVQTFKSDGWNPLTCAENDAREFYEWATSAHPVSSDEEGTVIRELLVGPMADRDALGNVIQRMNGAIVREGDTVLFFFAGHVGMEQDQVLNHRGQRDAYIPYLVTHNADPDNLRFTAVKRDDVLQSLQFSEASRCFFFCDACYSGGSRVASLDELNRTRLATRTRRRLDPDLRRPPIGKDDGSDRPGPKTVIFAAADEFHRAVEDQKLRHGLFTYALLEGLHGAADMEGDGDARVTLEELSAYVKDEVTRLSKALQRPFVEIPESRMFASTHWPVSDD